MGLNRKERAPLFLVVLLASGLSVGCHSGVVLDSAAQGHFGIRLETLLKEEVNRERKARGLSVLRTEADLIAAARAHSRDMLRRNFFSHRNPDGLDAQRRVGQSHRRLIGTVGENLWAGSGYADRNELQLARLIFRSLMGSPSHRENILRPQFSHLGIGVSGDRGELRVTQLFASVTAYLRRPLPRQVRQGAPLDLAAEKKAPLRYEYWSIGGKRAAAGPFPVSGARAQAPRGVYQLRFHFPAGRSGRRTLFDVVYGPEIELR